MKSRNIGRRVSDGAKEVFLPEVPIKLQYRSNPHTEYDGEKPTGIDN